MLIICTFIPLFPFSLGARSTMFICACVRTWVYICDMSKQIKGDNDIVNTEYAHENGSAMTTCFYCVRTNLWYVIQKDNDICTYFF